jgi:hypothetical protein
VTKSIGPACPRRQALLWVLLFGALRANAQITGQECEFAGCMPGEIVLTKPASTSAPGCRTAAIEIYVSYSVAMSVQGILEPAATGETARAFARLRTEARVAGLENALRQCVIVPSGQRALFLRKGEPKSGVVLIAPADGAAPYWLSALDIVRP